MTNKNILITGSTGFVGQNLTKYLTAHKSFRLFNLSRHQLNNINSSDLSKIDVVIHLAGKAHDLKSSTKPDEYYQVNYELTRRLYDAFLISDATLFIFMSSVKAAADRVEIELTEDMPPLPFTDYGKSKLMAENYLINQPRAAGKKVIILRPCMIHGPGNKGNLNLLYQVVNRGIPYPLASYVNKRSFLSVDNLLFVINQIMSSNTIESGVYQVADDIPLSTNDVVKILSESLKREPKLWYVPVGLINFFAKAGDRFHLPLNSERLQKLTENFVVSNEKIKKAINSPLPISSKDGLIITASSFNDTKTQ